MFCYLLPNKAIINDINKELISAYKAIQHNHILLMDKLDELQHGHSNVKFYSLRKIHYSDNVDIAARFIYLNKTCFNGMYRVNSKNEFNVPSNNKIVENLILYNKKIL